MLKAHTMAFDHTFSKMLANFPPTRQHSSNS